MNFLLSLIAAVFYALQAVLMAKIARKYGSLFAQTLRGLSFGITMLPLLLLSVFISTTDPIQILLFENTYLLIAAIIFAGLGNWCIASSNIFLPVAYGSAIGMSLSTIFLSSIGYFYFGDSLSVTQIFLIIFLILIIFLFVYQNKYPKIKYFYNPVIGYFCAFGFAIFMSIAFSIVAKLSRATSPFAVAFFWEFGIGIFLTLLYFTRRVFFNLKSVKINKEIIVQVMLYSSPTIVGTSCYAYALKIGPIPLVIAVQTSMLFFVAIISSFVFRERLSKMHWVLVFIMIAILVLIKIN